MAQEEILLSISVLISNRPDTVEKCLDSLASLRRRVPTELILVDTGCGEQVRGMIEPYADKIVDFEWCNDFSRARNAGLEQAVGEWFLYLDDDEWFEDTDEIEDFFLTGRYLQYNSGVYRQRNYFDAEGAGYRDVYVGRLFRLLSDVRFVYSIHEVFIGPDSPMIRLNSFVHHYGYVYKNAEEFRRHSRRNIELLLAEHEKDPSDLHHILQLAQEYNVVGEWEESIEISRIGIRNAVLGAASDCVLGGLYANIVRAFLSLKQYEKAVETGESYLERNEPNELARATVYCHLCLTYSEMGEYAKSLEAVGQYEEIRRRWEENPERFYFYENLLTDYTFSENVVKMVLYRGVRWGIRLGRAGLAKRYFEKLKWDTSKGTVDIAAVDMIQELLRAWLRTDADEAVDYTDMMKSLLRDSVLSTVVVTDMDLMRRKTPELLRNERADWAELAEENWLFLYYKVRNRTGTDLDALMEDYRHLWTEPGDVLMKAEELELWEIARRDGIRMGEVLSCIPVYSWRDAVEAAVGKMDWQEVQRLQYHMVRELDEDSFYALYWNISYKMRKIHVMMEGGSKETGDGKPSADDVVWELSTYAVENQKLCHRLYREELFLEMPGLLPRECHFYRKLLNMAFAVEKGNLQEASAAVKEALDIMPEQHDVLKWCAEWISEKAAFHKAEQEKAKEEMKNLMRRWEGK